MWMNSNLQLHLYISTYILTVCFFLTACLPFLSSRLSAYTVVPQPRPLWAWWTAGLWIRRSPQALTPNPRGPGGSCTRLTSHLLWTSSPTRSVHYRLHVINLKGQLLNGLNSPIHQDDSNGSIFHGSDRAYLIFFNYCLIPDHRTRSGREGERSPDYQETAKVQDDQEMN